MKCGLDCIDFDYNDNKNGKCNKLERVFDKVGIDKDKSKNYVVVKLGTKCLFEK